MSSKPIFICAIVGPTASGKTGLAIEIAKRNCGEIVSFDSMQLYKNAPIATAVPTIEERQGIPHHLMEFLDCNDSFSVAKYIQLAKTTITDIVARGKLPILVGGTGLYYSALLNNIQFQNQDTSHLKWRKRLEQRAEEEGIENLYKELVALDPVVAKKIHVNNRIRVIRGLEIYYATGKTLTQQEEESHNEPSPYYPCVIGLNYKDRSRLYQRINQRVYGMLKAGLVEEVKELYDKSPNGTLLQAIGIKEFASYFAGESSLEQVIEVIQKESRHYAKRQLTWFRRDQRVQWLYPDECGDWSQVVAMAQDWLAKKQADYNKEGNL